MEPRLRDPDVCEHPLCGGLSRVINKRRRPGYIWRRHACLKCGRRWTSWQYLVHPRNVNDDDIEPSARASVHNL